MRLVEADEVESLATCYHRSELEEYAFPVLSTWKKKVMIAKNRTHAYNR